MAISPSQPWLSLPSQQGWEAQGWSSPRSPGLGQGEDAASSDLKQRHREGESLGIPVLRHLQADPRARHTMDILSSQRGNWCLGNRSMCAESFGTAATPIPAQRQPGEHPWEAGALTGSWWGAEAAPSHSGD